MAKIMLIDDDPEILDILSAGLASPDTTVVTRDTPEGAVAQIVAERPDLLILDVMYPENPSGGFDLAREVRKTDGIAKVPIILLTAINQEFPTDFSRDDINERWFPVQDFIEKPVDIRKLRDRLKQILPGRPGSSE
ncbi:MAG TPA: response regulator [Spirochaetia bacterium]|nr:response regulator [Spirochaetia bacterium]